MPVNKRPMRYAHSDGHTDVCYSEDGKYLITGGNDGDIRLWMGLEDDDPTSHCVGEKALAVKQMGKRLFVGTDNNTVQAYTFPEVEPDGIITRFGAPVTHISVSKDGNTIAAASEDMEVHIYDVALQKSTVIASHTGPVFGVELDPKLEFVASCSGDGTVRVWNLSQNKLGHSWKCVPICNSFLLTKVLGRPSWLPSTGQLLALPNGKQVCLYKRGTWEQMTTLTNAQVEKELFRSGDIFKLFFHFFLPLFIALDSCCPLTISALSRRPQTMSSFSTVMYSYMQSGTNLSMEGLDWVLASTGGELAGSLTLLVVGGSKMAASSSTGGTKWVCQKQLAFNTGLIAFRLATIPSMAMNISDPPLKSTEFSIVTFSPCGKYLAGCTIGGDICVWDIKQELCVMHEVIKNKNQVCALAWNPSGSGELGYCDLTGQLGTIEGCIPVELNSNLDGSLKRLFSDHTLVRLGWCCVCHPSRADVPGSCPADDLDDDDAQSKVSLKISELQPPFQPSATPQHLQHRFMVWNSVGIVRCSNVPEDVIDVEFHDTSVHHALYIKNYMHHHIASLTQHALVLACEAEDGPSKLVCVLLNCWDGTREWQVDLPEGEGALCVALGEGWLAAATDTRMLRIWTLCGSQREVVTLPGPVLCLAGHKHKLIVVCHVGIGVAGDQNVSYCVMNLIRGQMSPWQPLPLTPGSTVQWIGFSDEGTPFMMDSTGSVRMLSSKGFWLPVLDTKTHVKGKSDHYFILGVSEKFQNIRAVLCKGSHYPPTTPRPPVVEIPLQVGLGDVTTERGQLEEIFWRSTLTGPSIPDPTDLEKAAKEAIIKLFALACRSDQQARAVELCSLMQGPQVVQLAMKYASKLGKSHLADRIADMDFSHLDVQQRRLIATSQVGDALFSAKLAPANEATRLSSMDRVVLPSPEPVVKEVREAFVQRLTARID
uniref:WD repeat-containing protein 55 homolog n=1 Tax=Timema monikensis TaxID=170555 RepID=A0A7R9E5H4_9NEOP|nr:unnamed protein product [Timema monikensis]